MATFRTLPPDWAADPTEPHLILVGLPGAGKTSVGQEVASRLGRPFLDFDREIERREGSDIASIFAEKGEPHFRAAEHRLTTELAELGGLVLSPGGGWVTNGAAVALLRPRARIVYLKVKPEIALQRMGPERATRPLLQRPDPLAELRRLLEERSEAYGGADHVIDTDLFDLQEVIEKVLALASRGGPE